MRQLSPLEARACGQSGSALLLDVRHSEEYTGELGHIAGARLIPLRELPDRAPAELAAFKDSDIVVICRAGVRSVTAAAILTGMGFQNVCSMKGGMLDWNDSRCRWSIRRASRTSGIPDGCESSSPGKFANAVPG